MAEQIITLNVEGAQSLKGMQQALREIVVLLKKQREETEKTREKTKKSVGDMLGALSHLTTIFSGALSAAKSFFGYLAPALQLSAKLGEEFTRSSARIGFTLEAISKDGGPQDAANKKLEDFAFWMSSNTEASALQVKSLQSVAISLNRFSDPKKTNDMVKAAMALQNVIPNRDAATLIGQLSQSLNGVRTQTLNMIPAVKSLTKAELEQGKAVEVINNLLAGGGASSGKGGILSAAVDTVSGRLNNLITITKDRWLTTLGRAIFENQGFAEALKKLGGRVEELAPKVEDLMPIIQKVVVAGASMVLAFANIVQGFNDLIQDMREPLATWADFILTPLKLVMASLTAVGIVLNKTGAVSDEFLEGMYDINRVMETVGSEGVNAFADGLDKVGKGATVVEALVSEAIQTITNYTKVTKKSGIQQQKVNKVIKATISEADLMALAFDVGAEAAADLEEAEKELKKTQIQGQIKYLELLEKTFTLREKEEAQIRRSNQEAQEEAEARAEGRKATVVGAVPGGEFVSKIVSGDAEDRKDAIAGLVAGAVSGISGAVMGLFDTFLQALKDPEFLGGLIDAVSSMISALGDKENIANVVEGLSTLIQNVVEALAEPDFFMNLIDGFIKLLLNIIKVILKNLPQILSNLVKAIVKGIGDFIEGLIDMLAEPDFLSNFIVGIVNLILDIISGIAKMIDRIILAILKNLIPIVIEVFKAIVKAIAQIFLRGMWEVIRIIIRIASFGTIDIGAAPGQEKEATAQDPVDSEKPKYTIGEQITGRERAVDTSRGATTGQAGGAGRGARFHSGGIFRYGHNGAGLGPGERIIAQDGEAMVIPIGPKKFNGMSTNGRGEIRGEGGNTYNITINTMDAESFEEVFRRRGLEVLIDAVEQNITDNRGRLLKKAVNA
jgi:hypothetical protein